MLMLSVILCGCGSKDVKDEPQIPDEDVETAELVVQEEEEVVNNEVVEEDTKMSAAKFENSGNFSRAAYIADKVYNGEDNVLISPVSLEIALGMLSEGAEGMTLEDLNEYLGTEDYRIIAKEFITEAAHDANPDQFVNSTLKVANSVWLAQDIEFSGKFKSDMEEYYHADLMNIDFKSGLAIGNINNWVSGATNGGIRKIIEYVEPNQSAILVNAVYFESPWNGVGWEPFVGTFTRADGVSNEYCDMIKTQTSGYYYSNDKAEAFGRVYEGGLVFIGILPKKIGDFSLTGLDLESLLESKSESYDIYVEMPTLNYSSQMSMNEILKGCGLASIYSVDADFHRMSDIPCHVTDIVQACNIQVDENGTKAAAATAISMIRNSAFVAELKEVKNLILDRPYAFLIYDESHDQILFCGKVVEK